MASRSVNKVILIGHLGRDAETAYTASQVAVSFSGASRRKISAFHSDIFRLRDAAGNPVHGFDELPPALLPRCEHSPSRAR